MYRTRVSPDVFAEINRLQRAMQQSCNPAARMLTQGRYPAINVGSTAKSVEIDCFVPGIEPDSIEVQLDKAVLTIAGQRTAIGADADAKTTQHVGERFTGNFRRVIALPDDIDANAVTATYRDGVLHVSVQRREAVQPRRITIQ